MSGDPSSAGARGLIEARERRGAAWAIAGLALLLLATAGWWAFALWPAPAETPVWLLRARQVCFNATPDGLPDASGWLLLVGQPIGMFAVLMAGWGSSVRGGMRALWSRALGRVAVAATALLLLAGVGAAGARVATAPGDEVGVAGENRPAETYPRLDRPAPELGLVDQNGETFDLGRLRGRPALVTFAFGHCETVCPVVVRHAREAQERARAREPDTAPRLVVVTLDPWRDTPSRLPHLARHWELGEEAWVLSGEVDDVNAALDRWQIPRKRDEQDGDLAHPPLVYVLDAEGRIAFGATAGAETIAELLRRT